MTTIKLSRNLRKDVVAWADRQPDNTIPSEAIRRMVEQALSRSRAGTKPKPARSDAHRAAGSGSK